MAKTKKLSIKDEIASQAIVIADTERQNWETAEIFVTEDVAFKMRDLIRMLRKNYWGIFESPIDKSTGREKIWVPLTSSLIEDVVKNIDIDQKDINFRARTPEGNTITDITRAYVKDYLSKMYFGEILDADERQVLIDGTVVWKTWKEKGELKRRTVDLLNVYIDPSEENVQSAYRVTERAVLQLSEIAGMDWANTQDLSGSQSLDKSDGANGSINSTPTTGNYRDVWEVWGKIPKWMVTEDKKDKETGEEIDGHIIISGLEAGQAVCHLVEKNTNKDKLGNIIKPYEELRIAKMTNRWYGVGTAERVLALQEWLNATVNIRQNRAYVSQLGLFKIKKGAGITPQMLAKLPANGAVTVQNMDDLQQMPIADIPVSSYKDEDVIVSWAQKVSQAYPVASGEIMPASATATSAAIANTNAKSSYVMIKEAIGMFIERWFDRHAITIIADTMKVGDIVRLSADDENFSKLVERVALYYAQEDLNRVLGSGIIPSIEELNMAIDNSVNELKARPELFLEAVQEIVASQLDTKIQVTNEDLDTSVTVTNLISMLNIAPEYRDSMVRQIFDLLGLNAPRKNVQPVAQGQAPQIEAPQPSLTGQMQGAMTM